MKLNNEELNLILDGCEDTLHRLKYDDEVNEDFLNYSSKVISLKKKIQQELESVKEK